MFKQTIPFTLKVNTPPPAIAKCVIARTNTASAAEPAYYVLCLQLPAAEMNRELNGSLVHKDIAGITINETSYSLSVNSAQKQFNVKAGSPFIDKDSVEKLAADAEEVPSGWTLYFKTNVAVGDAKKSYTISVKDEKGLYSKPVTAATQLSEPPLAQIDVIKGTLIPSLSGNGTEQSKAIVIKADAATPKAQIKLSVPATGGVSATGVTIHYRLTEVGQPSAPEQTKASPITVDMLLNGSGEKIYELIYYTAGVGFKPSASKTVYYKVLKEHTVTFSVDGGNGTLSATPQGGSENSTGTITVEHGKSVTFTATPTEGWEVDSWTGVTPDTSSPDKAKATLSSVTNTTTVTVKFKKKQAVPVSDWEALRTAVKNASDGDVIEVADNITYDFDSTNSTIKVNKNITIKSTEGHTYTLNAHGNGADGGTAGINIKGIFEVSGGKTLTLERLILTKAETSAVYVAAGDNSLVMRNVTITDCKTEDNAAGIYFNKGKDLTLLENCTIEKCKGTGSDSSGGMYIQEPKGTVSIKDTIIKNCEAQHDGGGIRLSQANCTLENVNIQECSAANGGGIYNRGSTLTITGGSFIKNKVLGSGANRQGGAIYSEGGSLTLDGFTIGGDNQEDGNTAKKGGGIYLKNVVVTMQSVKVKNNKALTQGGGIYLAGGELKIPGGNTIADNSIIDNGNSEAGGGIYVEKGMLTLDGGIIFGNSANANKGGGVYLKAGTFTMNSGEIKNCSAKYGGGVSLAGTSTFTMTGGTITGCKADVEGGKGGGIYTELKTKLTLEGAASNPVVISNCTAKETGGGMHIHTQNTVTVKNARIEENSANSGGGVYLEQGTFTIAGSTRITPSTETTAGQNDVFLKEGKFITISGALTAESPIARITPENYTVGAKVLEASSTEYAKFTVTPKDGNTWSIKSDGTLQQP